MSEKKYSDVEARLLVDALEHPVVLVRQGRILMANDAYCTLVRRSREQVEGRDALEMLAPEERERMAELQALRKAGVWMNPGHFFMLGFDANGRRVTFEVHTQRLGSSEGEDFTLASHFPQPEQANVDFTEALVDAAAAMVAERSREGVEAKALESLARHNLGGSFCARDGASFAPCPKSGAFAGFKPELADAALREGRPIFGGQPGWVPSQVYVPIRAEGLEPRVLALGGASFDTRLAPVFSLFARVLSSAMLNAVQHDVAGRRLVESQLRLDLARTSASSLDLAIVLDTACDFLVKLLDVSNCFILLYDARERVLKSGASSAQHRDFFRTVVISLEDDTSVASRVAREKRPVTVGPETIGRMGRQDLVTRFKETAVVGLPMMVRDELLGVIILDETRGPRQFPREWLELAEATASQLALSVANARLFDSVRQSYAELAQTRAEMVRRERLAALGELSAVVAHEVRNPLAVIFNAVSSLRRGNTEAGEESHLLDILTEESDRLNRIVNDLLDFTRPGELQLAPEDVEEVIQESMDAATSLSTGAVPITFDTKVEPGLPQVRLDRRRMRQALVNVAVNAMQAMPRGGTVRVRAGREGDGEGARVRIDLTDDGPGIPREIEGRIFEPFFTTKAQGTGLGLAVVKRILDDHRGEVEVTSASGGGTTFTFRLPMSA